MGRRRVRLRLRDRSELFARFWLEAAGTPPFASTGGAPSSEGRGSETASDVFSSVTADRCAASEFLCLLGRERRDGCFCSASDARTPSGAAPGTLTVSTEDCFGRDRPLEPLPLLRDLLRAGAALLSPTSEAGSAVEGGLGIPRSVAFSRFKGSFIGPPPSRSWKSRKEPRSCRVFRKAMRCGRKKLEAAANQLSLLEHPERQTGVSSAAVSST